MGGTSSYTAHTLGVINKEHQCYKYKLGTDGEGEEWTFEPLRGRE